MRSFRCRSLQLASKSKTSRTVTNRVPLSQCFRPWTEASDMPSTRKVTAHSSSSPRRSWLSSLRGGGLDDQPCDTSDLRDGTYGGRQRYLAHEASARSPGQCLTSHASTGAANR